MTRFKIDGLRDADNALVAADSGASFLGFVFVHGVRRQLLPEEAQGIIHEYRRRRGPGGPSLVGLFADQEVAEVNGIVEQCRLDMVGLCGDEPPDYWGLMSVPIIRQIKVRDGGVGTLAVDDTLRLVGQVVSHGHRATLDSHQPGEFGGTGRSFDWNIARQVGERFEFLLAGGLTPENVERAIATVRPWAVDVSSGVETDGVKDSDKILAFARAVQRADQGED